MNKKEELNVVIEYLQGRIDDMNRQAMELSVLEESRELTEQEEQRLSILVEEIQKYNYIRTNVAMELRILNNKE